MIANSEPDCVFCKLSLIEDNLNSWKDSGAVRVLLPASVQRNFDSYLKNEKSKKKKEEHIWYKFYMCNNITIYKLPPFAF